MKYKNIYLTIAFIIISFVQNSHAVSKVNKSTNNLKKYLCTTKRTNFIRQKPTTRSKLLVRLSKYVPLEVIEKSKKWFKVKGFKYSPFTGWIHKSIVTNEYSCMLINKTSNVSCPSRKSKNRKFYMHEGFKVLKIEIACNLVEDKNGKRYRINSLGSWPESLVKMIRL